VANASPYWLAVDILQTTEQTKPGYPDKSQSKLRYLGREFRLAHRIKVISSIRASLQ
jgi:hypothetical protein